jgi:peptide deformylase
MADVDVAAAPEAEAERERRAAALAQVRKIGDPVLRTRALEVGAFDARLAQLVEHMRAVMDDAYGLGLAATQVGTLQRLLVYRVEPDSPTIALVNPTFEWRGSELETAQEGCLSIPQVTVDVERPLHVRLRAFDEHGRAQLIEASGLEARVIQHEVDHLDGVLILDRTSREQRREALRVLREAPQ